MQRVEYEEDEFERILDLIADGEPRYKIFDRDGDKDGISIPKSAFNRRLREDGDFYERYLKALEFAADSMCHELIRIADFTQVEEVLTSRLRIDVRKFNISRADDLIQRRNDNKDANGNKSSKFLDTDDMGDDSREAFMQFMGIRAEELRKKDDGNE